MSDSALAQQQIVARIERLPFSAWHARILSIVGVANFFDAFDSLTIAFILPVLVGLWHLAPQEIGYLISIGFLGQLIGAVVLSYFAERTGRIAPLRWSIAIFSVLSLCCAFAWSYGSFLTFRLLQGLGLGAENPIASAYIGEMVGARLRGRMAFAFQAVFACAIFITAMVSLQVVPKWG
jgi:putative MFS transporter